MNKSIEVSSKKCIHGGDYDKCTGQCDAVISIENFRGHFNCVLDKGHNGLHKIKVKAVLTGYA